MSKIKNDVEREILNQTLKAGRDYVKRNQPRLKKDYSKVVRALVAKSGTGSRQEIMDDVSQRMGIPISNVSACWTIYRKMESRRRKSLTAKEWSDRIEKIKDFATKVLVARIVWWDYLGGRPFTEKKTELSGYVRMDFQEKVPGDQIVNALVQVGYDRSSATGRVSRAFYEEM